MDSSTLLLVGLLFLVVVTLLAVIVFLLLSKRHQEATSMANQAPLEPVSGIHGSGAPTINPHLSRSRNFINMKPLSMEGGFSVIYHAYDINQATECVIKMLKAEFSFDQDALREFEREAEILQQIQDYDPRAPITRILGEGKDMLEGSVQAPFRYIELEFIAGDTNLSHYLRRHKRLNPADAELVVAQIIRALLPAHQLGISHRDLKPGNILLRHGKIDSCVVCDFGLAKPAHDDEKSQAVKGTNLYMSPEQCQLLEKTVKTDVFSLAMMWFEMLTGKKMFADLQIGNYLQYFEALKSPGVDAYLSPLPENIARILSRMLAMDAAQRPDLSEVISVISPEIREQTGLVGLPLGPGNAIATESETSTETSGQAVTAAAASEQDDEAPEIDVVKVHVAPTHAEVANASSTGEIHGDAGVETHSEAELEITDPSDALITAVNAGGEDPEDHVKPIVQDVEAEGVPVPAEDEADPDMLDELPETTSGAGATDSSGLYQQRSGSNRVKLVVAVVLLLIVSGAGAWLLVQENSSGSASSPARLPESRNRSAVGMNSERPVGQSVQRFLPVQNPDNSLTLGEMHFVHVSAGTFLMGSSSDAGAMPAEKPAHSVTIRRDYWILSTEVTESMWRDVLDEGASSSSNGIPKTRISWRDAMRFARILQSRIVGRYQVSLPTEAEWEFAYWLGEADKHVVEGRQTISPFSDFPVDAIGCRAMDGNVYEWTSSCYSTYEQTAKTDATDQVCNSGLRVVRGQSWRNQQHPSATRRQKRPETQRASDLGFRIVLWERE
jgi:serine/threonine protein kinase